MGLAVSGRNMKPLVMPGYPSGRAMCGMKTPRIKFRLVLVLVGCFCGEIFLADVDVAFACDPFAALAVHCFIAGLGGCRGRRRSG